MTARLATPPVAPAGLASRLSPPFRLPGEHFAAGTVFLVLAAAGLVWVAPELAAGMYPSPRLVAVAHLFTLGWITLSIFGALYQFMPVALGEPVRSTAAAHLTFALYVPGLLAFVGGLASGLQPLMLAGAASFGAGVFLFCGNLAATLWRAGRRDLTWWSLVAADVYLFLTAVLGLLLATNLRMGFLGVGRWTALGVHIHMALAGWVLMVVIGVAHRLLPMFLLSHGAAEGWGRAAAGLVAGGVAWLVAFHHAPPPLAHWVPALLIGAGLGGFLLQARAFFGHRVKPKLDPGLRLAGAGLLLLAVGLGLGAASLAAGFAPARLPTAYVAALVLGFSLFVAGHYYKIVPFLVWFHRYGPLIPERPVPRVAELYSERAASVAGALLAAGFIGVVAATLGGSGSWVRVAASVATAGAAVEATQMFALAMRRP